MNRYLKNIFVQNTEDVILYKSKSSRGALAKIPARDKNFHGSKLKTMFEQAWSIAKKDVEERSAVSLPTKHGMYIEFCSASDNDLITKSLEDQRAGIRLLNVRKENESGREFRCCGYGVPSLVRAMWCANNSVNLIVQTYI